MKTLKIDETNNAIFVNNDELTTIIASLAIRCNQWHYKYGTMPKRAEKILNMLLEYKYKNEKVPE